MLRTLRALIAVALLAAASGCGRHGLTPDPDSTGPAVPGGTVRLPRPAHVLVVVFENKGPGQVLGSPAAPYLTGLAHRGALYTHATGVAHPSEPNYLALFSGSTHGLTSDKCPVTFPGAPNLAQQLRAGGRSFVGYAESLPSPGYQGCSAGDYARKHAPWVNFPSLPGSVGQPFSRFPTSLSRLPTVAFVVPNLCNDMHSCSVATGDGWARAHLAPYVAWARTHNSLLIVTFDEDDGTTANRILTFLVGPMVRRGSYRQVIDHYNVLRTLEEMYGLAPLGAAGRAAPLACWSPGPS